MFCSAMPMLISRSGNAFWKAPSLLEPTESWSTATMRASAAASAISVPWKY
jgi:hypothetical protein